MKDRLGGLTGIDYGTLLRLEKHTKGSLHRLLCRQCAYELSTPIPSRDQNDFLNTCTERAKHLGPIGLKKGCESISWAVFGWYILQPPLPQEAAPAQHRFTSVSLSGKLSIDLPPVFCVTGEWSVSDNFALRSAFLAPPTKGKATKEMKFKLFQAFGEVAGFAAWAPATLQRLKEVNPAQDDDDDGDGEAEDHKEEEEEKGEASAAASAPPSATPSKKRKGLRGLVRDATSGGTTSGAASSGSMPPPPKKRATMSPAKLKMLLTSK